MPPRRLTQEAINQLGSASLAVAVGNLENTAPAGSSHQSHQQAVVRHTQELAEATTGLANAKSSLAIATSAKQMSDLLPLLAAAACNAACTTKDPRAQDRIINLSKDLAEAEHDLLGASALVAGDPKSAANREKVTGMFEGVSARWW
jgi:hypothetical protein